jgi:site-specific DNA recombinase
MRAALYARFSTDMQRQASIEDQMALCRDLAAKLGATVVAEYSDAGISGFGVGSAAATPP